MAGRHHERIRAGDPSAVASPSSGLTVLPRHLTGTAEHDLLVVRGAIELVASGGALRVTLVSVQSAEAILPEAQAIARERGVVARAIWRSTDDGCDVAVEPIA